MYACVYKTIYVKRLLFGIDVVCTEQAGVTVTAAGWAGPWQWQPPQSGGWAGRVMWSTAAADYSLDTRQRSTDTADQW